MSQTSALTTEGAGETMTEDLELRCSWRSELWASHTPVLVGWVQ